MGFRLVPKSTTLNDLERRNGCIVCVISPNLVAFVANYVKVVTSRSCRLNGSIVHVTCHVVGAVTTVDEHCVYMYDRPQRQC